MRISSFVKFLTFTFFLLAVPTSCEKEKAVIVKRTDNTAEIKMLIDKGNYYFNSFKNDSAIYCVDKSISLCKPIENYVDDYVYSLTIKANILQNNGDFYASEEEITKTLPYLKKTSKPKFKYNVYTLIAYNYFHNYDFKNALLNHQKALKLADTPFKKSVITADIAILYLNQKKYKEAINLLEAEVQKKVKHKSDSTRTINHHSLLLNNLGYCYMQTNNPKALRCLEKSLELILYLNDYYELIGTYNILAVYHNKHKNFKLAKFYAEKAYYCSIKAKTSSMEANCLATLIKLSEGKTLKKYSQLYINIIDSITNGRKIHQNQSSNIKYNFKKDKEENLELKNQKAEKELQFQIQKNRSSFSYIIISAILFVSIFIVYFITAKGKREKNDTILKSEMRISDKLHNELTTDIYQILSFVENNELESAENKEKFLSDLNNIYAKTRNISRENSNIITNQDYDTALKNMISGFQTFNVNILINGLNDINWIKINKHKKIIIYRVLQEVFLNMKKHSNGTLAGINFKITEKKIIINYTDNGNGAAINEITKSGLAIVQNRISSIRGETYIDSTPDKGFKISFKIPV